MVDDLEANRDLVALVLKERGLDVETCSTGHAALALLEGGRRFAAVLMDVQMPGIDGVTTVKRIRALPSAASKTPVLALTALVTPQCERACLDAGMEAYLVKPIDFDQLLAVLTKLTGVEVRSAKPCTPSQAEVPERLMAQYLAYLQTVPASLMGALRTHDPQHRSESLRTLAHKLAGSAGSFGYPDLSKLAFALEREAILQEGDTEVQLLRWAGLVLANIASLGPTRAGALSD